MKIIEFLKGKKTYILSALGVIYGVSGYVLGHLDGQTALGIIWTSLGFSTVRSAIASQ